MQAVSNCQHSAVCKCLPDSLLNQQVSLRVHSSCRFIQYQHLKGQIKEAVYVLYNLLHSSPQAHSAGWRYRDASLPNSYDDQDD